MVRSVRPSPPTYRDVFGLRVTLRHIRPAIWRSLQAPAELTLGQIHQVLQIAFGWQDSHLHDFVVHDIRFGMVDVEDEYFSVDEQAAPLGAVANTGSTFVYRYDFGDDWEHEVKVEGVIERGQDAILCTGGARACPPEDCGGAPGYAQLLKILADPKHEEHADSKRWVGRGYDPEKFDVAAVNKRLTMLAKRLGRRRK
jgi:hypothetical protein